jgi:hypothetical protein
VKSHRVGASLVAAVLVSALSIALALPALASDPPGNNGTIKIHEQGTPSGTESNDPKVCVFNVEGYGFDVGQQGYLMFTVQGGDAPTGTDSGPHSFGPTTASAEHRSYYETGYFRLDPGHYKATLYGKFGDTVNFRDEKAKSKVFKVECEQTQGPTPTPTPVAPTPTPTPVTPTPTPTPPGGGSTPTPTPAGGGGATPTPTPAGEGGGATPTPAGNVAGETGTPGATLPATNTLESAAQPAGNIPVVLLVLMAIGSIAIGATVLRPRPTRPVRTRR